VRRLLVSCAFLFGTWAGVLTIVDDGLYLLNEAQSVGLFIAPLAWIAAIAVTAWFTLRRREDIYPLAVVMGSFIAVSLVWMAKAIDANGEGVFLLFALYLVAISAVGGRVLLTLFRRWRVAGAT
jgi:hypothetical protein